MHTTSTGLRERGSVHILPLTREERERAIARAHSAPQGSVSVMEIARRLKMTDGVHAPSKRTIIAHIRNLHRNHGFPEPANPRFVHGVRLRGERAIVWRSTWARDLVEAWFSHDDTPVNAALARVAGQERTRAALAANAARLAGGRG